MVRDGVLGEAREFCVALKHLSKADERPHDVDVDLLMSTREAN